MPYEKVGCPIRASDLTPPAKVATRNQLLWSSVSKCVHTSEHPHLATTLYSCVNSAYAALAYVRAFPIKKTGNYVTVLKVLKIYSPQNSPAVLS